MLSSPVARSRTAPVADWYLFSASVASRIRVVPRKMGYFRVIYQDILGMFPLTGVNNTSSGVKDAGRVSIVDRLVDSPVVVSW